MTSFTEWEKITMGAITARELHDQECIACPKCGGEWMEEVKAQRFKDDHNVVIGQPVPSKPGSIPYIILRCLYCNNMIEPRVVHQTRDIAGGDYNHFLDTVEGKMDKRKTAVPAATPAVTPDAVQGQKQ